MPDVPLELACLHETTPGPGHTATSVGNVGVEVVGTPFLVGYLEIAAHHAILPCCEPGEVTVGTRIEVDHLAAALPGRPVVADAKVVAVEGRPHQLRGRSLRGPASVDERTARPGHLRLDKLLARAAAAE